jgi:hypothetical protein
MPKIPLTIDPSYCRTWEYWEGVRELIQNAKDAEEFDQYKMTVDHSPRSDKLTVSNADVVVPASTLLLLGRTSKTEGGQRGKFGEGFALGCLALTRAGHSLTIYNGDEVWRPIIEKAEDGPFKGEELLVFQTRKLQSSRPAFSIEVENVTKEMWERTRERFLFLEPPKEHEVVKVGYKGSVLLSPERKGAIYCKGIYVNTVGDLEYGYDLEDAQLDRDRRMIDEWDLKYKLSTILNEAHSAAPDTFAPRIYEMVKNGKKDTTHLEYSADAKLLKALRESYAAENGDAVPVTSMQESRALELVGARTAVVNKSMQTLLKKAGLDADEEKQRRQNSVKELLSWSALTEAETEACTRLVEKITQDYAIVTFHNEALAVFLLPDSKVGIARWALTSKPLFLVKEVALVEAKRQGQVRSSDEILAQALLTAMNIPSEAPPAAASEVLSEPGFVEVL